jgi:hypothetical protein
MTPEEIIRHAWERRPAGQIFNPLDRWRCNVPIMPTTPDQRGCGSAIVDFQLTREINEAHRQERFRVVGAYGGTTVEVYNSGPLPRQVTA